MTSMHDADVVVVGAGLVGAACALRLAEDGRSVVLLDAQEPGNGASFGNAGHVATEQMTPLADPAVIRASWRYLLAAESPLRVRPAYLLPILPWLARFVWAARPAGFARGVAALFSLQQHALQDLADLLALAGIRPLLHRDGYLRLWESAQGAREARDSAARMEAFGVRSESWSASRVRALAPALGAAVDGAIWYADTAHVDDPHAVCRGLVAALRMRGGEVRRARATRLVQEGAGPVRVDVEGGTPLRARQVVLAAGAWSRSLAEGLGYRVPLDTERGYHITVPWGAAGAAHAPPRLPMPMASAERNVIMTPMTPGLRMTGTLEFGGLHLPPDPRRWALLHRQMQALLPGIATEGASTWMGFRPSLPDHLPMIGAAPRHPGVFFAFGHQHLGLTLSGVTARLVCDLLQGRPPAVDLVPFRVDRF
jgi:glycine/D-amino acid oxidase-like deaminating enzyme